MAQSKPNTRPIYIHRHTRKKLDQIKRHKPAWSIQTIADEAIDALTQKLGITHPQAIPSSLAPSTPAA